ncbi:MAG TPA: hypothetical protein VKH34_02595, partial [Vicinamibacterales bacterium]|nr:hypothetical protein [Vicinamibacterales bacterium]
ARLDPADPAPERAIAAITWMELLFSQGAATFEAFTGQASKSDVARPTPPPALVARFTAHIKKAMALAEAGLTPRADADAHYQMGATAALSAIYRATVEGKTVGALGEGRRAVKEMQIARKLAPGKREPALVLGLSEYTVSTLAFPVRWLAGLTGLGGNRGDALALLEQAASGGADTEADALLVLMVVYNREGNHAAASDRLARLRARFPQNRLLYLNAAVTAIEAGQYDSAERDLIAGLTSRDLQSPPVAGEHALWLLKRGTARAALGRATDALTDLSSALAAAPRDWVRGRTHFELARLALARREAAEAARQLQLAIEFGEKGGDADAVKAAQSLLKRTRQ